MANPTTNFGWVMPTSTSLVTNLPADFNTFGQGVDTSMAQLKGGTTGQILSKTSATDMAFTWITNDVGDITAVTAGTGISGGGTSGAVTITNSMATEIAAKGDLIVGTGSATFDNLGVGTNGQVLTADSTVSPTGLKWATASSGSQTLLSTTTLSGTSTTISSISGSYRHLYIYGYNICTTSGTASLQLIWNGFTVGTYGTVTTAGAYSSFLTTRLANAAGINDAAAARASISTAGSCQFYCNFPEYTMTDQLKLANGWINPTYSEDVSTFAVLNDTSNAAVTSFKITTTGGTASLTGTVKIYGVN